MDNNLRSPIEVSGVRDGPETAVRRALWEQRSKIAKGMRNDCDLILDIDVSDEGPRFVFVDFKDSHDIEWQQLFELCPTATGGMGLVFRGDPTPLDEAIRAAAKRVGPTARKAAFAAGRPVVVWRDGALVEEYADGTTRTIDSDSEINKDAGQRK